MGIKWRRTPGGNLLPVIDWSLRPRLPGEPPNDSPEYVGWVVDHQDEIDDALSAFASSQTFPDGNTEIDPADIIEAD